MPLYNPNSSAGALQIANNLSDLNDAAAARENLGSRPYMDPDFSDSGIYLTSPAYGSAVGAGNMFSNTLYMIAIWVPRTRTYSTYALAVTTGTATSVIRLGLYNANSALQPTTKIDEIGTPLDGTTIGLKTSAFGANVSLKPGWYFLAAVTNVTTPVVRVTTPANAGPLGSFLWATGSVANQGKTRSFTYGALPSDETASSYSSAASASVALPFVGIR